MMAWKSVLVLMQLTGVQPDVVTQGDGSTSPFFWVVLVAIVVIGFFVVKKNLRK